MGCTMAPEFLYEDWELGDCDDLARRFPASQDIVRQYCRSQYSCPAMDEEFLE